jgi:hypothetical protein
VSLRFEASEKTLLKGKFFRLDFVLSSHPASNEQASKAAKKIRMVLMLSPSYLVCQAWSVAPCSIFVILWLAIGKCGVELEHL